MDRDWLVPLGGLVFVLVAILSLSALSALVGS